MTKLNYSSLIHNMARELELINKEPRAMIILLQSHLEFMIDRVLELSLRTNVLEKERVPLRIKLEILYELGWIAKETRDDVNNLADIRAWMAHKIDIKNVQIKGEILKKIENLNIVKRSDVVIFPKGEKLENDLNRAWQLYMQLFRGVYDRIEKMKKKRLVLKRPKREIDIMSYRMGYEKGKLIKKPMKKR